MFLEKQKLEKGDKTKNKNKGKGKAKLKLEDENVRCIALFGLIELLMMICL